MKRGRTKTIALDDALWALLDRLTILLRARVFESEGKLSEAAAISAIVHNYLLEHREEILKDHAQLLTDKLTRTAHALLDPHERALAELALDESAPTSGAAPAALPPRHLYRGALRATLPRHRSL